MPEYMANTLAQGVRAIKGFRDLRSPSSWLADGTGTLVLGQMETVVRNVVRPVPATVEGTTMSRWCVWLGDSGRSRIEGKFPFSWVLNVQRRSPPFVTARAMRPVVAAWKEAVRLSMVEHRERVRALSLKTAWYSFWGLGWWEEMEGRPWSVPLAKLRRRGSWGMEWQWNGMRLQTWVWGRVWRRQQDVKGISHLLQTSVRSASSVESEFHFSWLKGTFITLLFEESLRMSSTSRTGRLGWWLEVTSVWLKMDYVVPMVLAQDDAAMTSCESINWFLLRLIWEMCDLWKGMLGGVEPAPGLCNTKGLNCERLNSRVECECRRTGRCNLVVTAEVAGNPEIRIFSTPLSMASWTSLQDTERSSWFTDRPIASGTASPSCHKNTPLHGGKEIK